MEIIIHVTNVPWLKWILFPELLQAGGSVKYTTGDFIWIDKHFIYVMQIEFSSNIFWKYCYWVKLL